MNVEEVMTRVVHTCRSSDSLQAVARTMWDRDVGAVVVTDFKERPIGVITDRDICMAALLQGKPLEALRVESAMSRAVYTCHPGDRLSAAERTLRQHAVRRIPVVNDEFRLVGILTLNDIIRARVSLPAATGRRLLADAAVTLADISRRPTAARPSHAYEARAERARTRVAAASNPRVQDGRAVATATMRELAAGAGRS